MKSFALFLSAASLLAATAIAAPRKKRTSMCGQWDTATAGPYTM